MLATTVTLILHRPSMLRPTESPISRASTTLQPVSKQLVSQVAFSRHRSLTRSVRRFGPVESDCPPIQLGRVPHPQLAPKPLSCTAPGPPKGPSRRHPGEGTKVSRAARPTTSMKSLSRDNARFSQPTDWSLNTIKPWATAGSRSAIPPGEAKGRQKKGLVGTRTNASPCGRFFSSSLRRTLNSGAEDADDPNRCEVNEMILISKPQPDTEAQSHSFNERICETTPEKTNHRGLAGTPGNQGAPAGRRQNERPRSTPPASGTGWRRGCASWPASWPAPTCGGRHPVALRGHRTGKLASEQFANPLSIGTAICFYRAGPDRRLCGPGRTTKPVPEQRPARYSERAISPGQWGLGTLPREESD